MSISHNIFFLFLPLLFLTAWTSETPPSTSTEGDDYKEFWVDSVFQTLNTDQRLGQLFMIRAHSDRGADHINHVLKQVKEYGVGGLCFFQGAPLAQARLTTKYQNIAKVPLMVSMDAEWGLGMRMPKSTISFPRQMTLGAIQDNTEIYKMGAEIARQLRRLGVHINFAPVVDVNNNPNNPVINTRSFGENRINVSVKSYQYAQGMQDHGVMPCAKHFPGHGDTDTDSHHDLPVINHSRERLDSVELFPFRTLTRFGVGSVMVAHLQVPALDATKNLPTTLSRKVIKVLLKKEMNFKGLVFTDALEMKGVTKHFPPGEIEIKALEAGVDVLLMPNDVDKAIQSVKAAFASGRLDSEEIFGRVKKILAAKYDLGLLTKQRVEEKNLLEDLNTKEALAMKRNLITKALTLAADDDFLLPIKKTDSLSFATISLGVSSKSVFQKTIGKFVKADHFQFKTVFPDEVPRQVKQFDKHDIIFVGLHDMSSYAKKNWGLTQGQINFVNRLSAEKTVILTVFGSPYCLTHFEYQKHVLVAFSEDKDYQELAAQALFGVTGIKGRLPVTPLSSPGKASKFQSGTGITTNRIFRLGYSSPEEVGMSSTKLAKIDTIAKEMISKKAAPGCVVLVAKKGKIVFHKAYGRHTYSSKSFDMKTDDLFDVASITKVAATTLALMKLRDEKKFNIYHTLGTYLPELDTTNKKNLIAREVMAHRSGLKSWIPFYKKTLTKSRYRHKQKPLKKFYRTDKSDEFSVPVANNLYLHTNYDTAIWNGIYNSVVFEDKKYRYSDLGFYMMGAIIEKQAEKPMNKFLETGIYRSLGLKKTCFVPWKKYSTRTIVPSEDDRYFRHQKVQGYVHDMGSALMGGVAGHAGLFTTSEDLAVIFQMLLNQGFYAGEQILSADVVRQFISRHEHCTRRGVGFDMKELDPSRKQNVAQACSPNTFGHIGFTGTCVWADPDEQLIYIFLSNRTYPNHRDYKLNKINTRGRIHAAIYDALQKDPSAVTMSGAR